MHDDDDDDRRMDDGDGEADDNYDDHYDSLQATLTGMDDAVMMMIMPDDS